MTRIIQDAESGHFERVKAADIELLAASEALRTELRKLYGRNSGGIARAFTNVMHYIDLKSLINWDLSTFVAQLARGVSDNADRIQKTAKTQLLKRNLALLSGMAKTRATATTISDLVRKVFNTTLSEDQLAALQSVTQQQASAIRPLRKGKHSSAEKPRLEVMKPYLS